MAQVHVTGGAAPVVAQIQPVAVVLPDRPVLNRADGRYIQIVGQVEPGKYQGPCCEVCAAPAMCPCLSICICCSLPKYIKAQIEASKFVTLTENGLMYNAPMIVGKEETCCTFRARDNVMVMHYDDPEMSSVEPEVHCCHGLRSWLCGGIGEPVALRSACCGGRCIRTAHPCCFVPSCCHSCTFCCPAFVYSRMIYVDNAKDAVAAIKAARDTARQRMK